MTDFVVVGGQSTNVIVLQSVPSTVGLVAAGPQGIPGVIQTLDVASTNGFGGSVAGTTNTTITLTTNLTGLLKGNGSAMSAATAIDDLPIGSTTPSTGAFTTLSATGNVTLGDATTDTVAVNGYMGVGGVGSSATGLRAIHTALTGVSQDGIQSAPTGTSAATTQIRAFSAQPGTAAAAFTCASVYGYRALNAVLGAGSTITNQYGFYVDDQTNGTNNYGAFLNVSSGTNKWNIYASGTAANYFAGNVQIGSTGRAVGGTNPKVQIEGTNTNTSYLSLTRNSNDSVQSGIQLSKSRGTTTGSFTIVNNGDGLGTISYLGSDGTADIQAAAILGSVDAAPSAGIMPGNLRFFTTGTSGAGAERMRIDSSGNVGVGTTSPGARLHVYQDDATTNAVVMPLRVSHTTTGTAANGIGTGIAFEAENAAGGAPSIAYIQASLTDATAVSSDLSFWTRLNNGSLAKVMTLNANGALALQGGNTSATGVGVAFPAAQSASSDANTLDDYEEGTFTPSVGGTATYTTQNGAYTKIGRVVVISGTITINAIGTGSTTAITGLPFASASSHNGNVYVGYRFGSVSSVTQLVGMIVGGSSQIDLISSTAASNTVASNAIFGAGTRVDFTATYYV